MLSSLPRFPCAPDKRPLISDWPNNATFDPINDYKAPWINEHLWPLTGVLTGSRSGFDVLDIDPRGMEWLAAREIPVTRRHRTRRGGWHILFQHKPGLRGSAGRISEGVDVRADGNYVIWWPRQGLEVIEEPLAEWPGWLFESALFKEEAGWNLPTAKTINHASSLNGSNPRLAIIRRDRRVRSILEKVESAPVGTRNNCTYWAACRLKEMVDEDLIAPAVAETLLIEAARVCGLVRDDGHQMVLATIRSGIRER